MAGHITYNYYIHVHVHAAGLEAGGAHVHACTQQARCVSINVVIMLNWPDYGKGLN